MLRWVARLFGLENPKRSEMLATQDATRALEARIDDYYAELKKLRGRVNAFERWRRHDEVEEEGQPAAQPDISPRAAPPQVTPSSQLSRRFRGF